MNAATACWEERGCDEEMASRCPHAISSVDGLCVVECRYTVCDRPHHTVATSFDLLLDSTLDRSAAIKEACTFCEFFLSNAPRIKPHVEPHVKPHVELHIKSCIEPTY